MQWSHILEEKKEDKTISTTETQKTIINKLNIDIARFLYDYENIELESTEITRLLAKSFFPYDGTEIRERLNFYLGSGLLIGLANFSDILFKFHKGVGITVKFTLEPNVRELLQEKISSYKETQKS